MDYSGDRLCGHYATCDRLRPQSLDEDESQMDADEE